MVDRRWAITRLQGGYADCRRDFITDDCTYQADQIPAMPLSKCLTQLPEYPICRAEAGIAFVPAASAPEDDAEFNTWFRTHATSFFEVSSSDYARLFGLHSLEHKRCGDGQVAFDGLCCDGAANYVKLVQKGPTWSAIDSRHAHSARKPKQSLNPG